MIGALLLVLTAVQCVWGGMKPIVKRVPCENQKGKWLEELRYSYPWTNGAEHTHQGMIPEMKENRIKVADFFVTLSGMYNAEASVLCSVDLHGTRIRGFWLDRAHPTEATDTFAFFYPKGRESGKRQFNRDKFMFGMRARNGQSVSKMRVQIYTKKTPSTADIDISCGAGPRGELCPDAYPWYQFNIEIRDRVDTA